MDAEPKTKADAMDGGMETGGRNGRRSARLLDRSSTLEPPATVPMQGA